MSDAMTEALRQQNLATDREVDRLAATFEQHLRRGTAPTIEAFLADHLSLGAQLRVELITAELEHRHETGAKIDWSDYVRRFPLDVARLEELRGELGQPLEDSLSEGNPDDATRVLAAGEVAEAEAPLAPLRLADYRLESRLGKGGQGEVWLARELSLDRSVAIKLLLASTSEDQQTVQRFLREARTLAQTRHPHIVTIHGLGKADSGSYFLVMEHIDGDDLAKQLKQQRFEAAQAVKIVLQIGAAVEHAHHRQVIHRDLKPSNVLWDSVRGPVVTDFGLAKELNAGDELTMTEQLIGTPSYMAPEQVSRKFGPVGTHTDVYGLAATLFALLTGQPPYIGSLAEVLQSVVSDAPSPDVRALQPDLCPDLASICRNAMAKPVQDRLVTMFAFREQLEGWLAGKRGGMGVDVAPPPLLPAHDRNAFGKYRLIEPMSQDRTRKIFHARTPDDQDVLLKILPAEWLTDRLVRSQFRQEVLLSTRLKHPSIARVIEAGTWNGAEFLALEFRSGPSVSQLLAQEGALSPQRAAAILCPIAEALQLVHEAGVIYRDLRPQNILLPDSCPPTLAEVRFSEELEPQDNLTLVGHGAVTSLYVAPETFLGNQSTVASDVYTLGATLYAMVTGVPPFQETANAIETMIAKTEGRYVPPKTLAPNLSEEVIALISAAMSSTIAHRPATAREFAERLRRATMPTSPDSVSTVTTPDDAEPLLLQMWEQLTPDLQNAFSLAYNKKRRSGSSRISTKDIFEALGRLGQGPMRELMNALPLGAMPEAADPSISTEPFVLNEQPLLSDCMQNSLEEFRKLAPTTKVASVDLFVDVAKYGHGASVARLREHGVDPEMIENIVRKLDLPVIRRSETLTETTRDPIWDDNVQFSVYRPKVVRPKTWSRLLAFAHLAELPADAPSGTPDPLAEVQRQAKQILGQDISTFQSLTADSNQSVPRSGELSFSLSGEGLEFNPPMRRFQWLETVHREEFRFRASDSLDGKTARGRMSVFLGSILIAEVTLLIRVDRNAQVSDSAQTPQRDAARRFRRIYACVCPEDEAVAAQFRTYATTLNDEFLLAQQSAGDSDRKQLIQSADIFQLFWSHNAMKSPRLAGDWHYALSLGQRDFIRPLYWQDPFPRSEGLPTPELMALGFQKIPSAAPTPRIQVKLGRVRAARSAQNIIDQQLDEKIQQLLEQEARAGLPHPTNESDADIKLQTLDSFERDLDADDESVEPPLRSPQRSTSQNSDVADLVPPMAQMPAPAPRFRTPAGGNSLPPRSSGAWQFGWKKPAPLPQFGDYRATKRLGSGGFGAIYQGRGRNQQLVFIRELPRNQRVDPQLELRKTLRHPGVVALLDFGETATSRYTVSEFVEGKTLRAVTTRPLNVLRAVRFAIGLAHIVDELLQQNWMIRQWTPDNIFVARHDQPKLDGFEQIVTGSPVVLSNNSRLGDPLFASPEQQFGQPLDPVRHSVFGLGALLYFMLTGKPPRVAHAIAPGQSGRTWTASPASQNRAGLDAELDGLVMQMLATLPEDRQDSIPRLIAALEHVLHRLESKSGFWRRMYDQLVGQSRSSQPRK